MHITRVNPNISSYAYLFGTFGFHKTLLAPLGTKVVTHEKSKDRGSWDYHCMEGWYVGPSFNNYCCMLCYNLDTLSKVDTDTVQLVPSSILIPMYRDIDAIKDALQDI